jgi:hypothetical protein
METLRRVGDGVWLTDTEIRQLLANASSGDRMPTTKTTTSSPAAKPEGVVTFGYEKAGERFYTDERGKVFLIPSMFAAPVDGGGSRSQTRPRWQSCQPWKRQLRYSSRPS